LYFAQIRRNKFLFPGGLHYLNAAGSPLHGIPDFQQTSVAILLPLMVPETKGLNPLPRQIFFPHLVPLNAFRQTVLKAVEFDIQLRVRAVKIQDMSANHMLPAEFEAGELPSAQCPPKLFFFVGLIAAKQAGDFFEAHADRMQLAGKNSSSSPRQAHYSTHSTRPSGEMVGVRGL
jgi:hypothetical protein